MMSLYQGIVARIAVARIAVARIALYLGITSPE
jgi:hypothetical protein